MGDNYYRLGEKESSKQHIQSAVTFAEEDEDGVGFIFSTAGWDLISVVVLTLGAAGAAPMLAATAAAG